MYSINHSQNGLSTASGVWIRGYKKAAKAIIQEDPILFKSLLQVSSQKLQMIIERAKNKLLANLASLSTWQPSAFDSSRKLEMKSNETYFENNYGFKEAELLVKPIAVNAYDSHIYRFITRQTHTPLITSVRGFKTRRAMEDWRPFQKKKREEGTDNEHGDVLGFLSKSVDGQKSELEHLSGILKKAELSPEELSKMYATINAFAVGYASGKGELEPNPQMAGSSNVKLDGGLLMLNKKGAQTKSNAFSKINKVATILLAIAILLSLVQLAMGGLPSLRFSGGAQEIAPEEIEARFDDVKGCDEAKQELQEIVEFLMNPDKFSALGGKLPKGVLLSGPPGTGKTLLAKAVAGQAGVPFFHAAGSEFDEVLVGQGARRVRDLFRAAKARAPCVIFIDEIDSVGSKRTSSVLHPYANQTINQLLSEMDGFRSNEGIIVLGATNRPTELDKALLRPGRFDTRVTVAVPDVKGRKEIIELYLSKVKYSTAIDIEKMAKRTIGFSGADIQNLINTAAIRAAVEGKEHVTMADLEYAYDKQVMGSDLKSRVRDADDIKITAYHEAGHTLVALFTKDANPVHKVTIVAKGQSGGHTAFLKEKDSNHQTKSQLLAMLDVGMGGRAAEEMIFGKDMVTGGASADFSNSTSIAEEMVKRLGMSEKLGFRVFDENSLADGRIGDSTKALIDDEVNSLLNDSYKRAMSILKSHRREMELLAEALINHETLDGDDVKAVIEGRPLSPKRKEATENNRNNAASQTGKMFKSKPIVIVVPPNVEQSPK